MALVELDLNLVQELGDEEVMEKYINEAEELSYDNMIIREYDKEFALKDEGRKEGRYEEKSEIAIKMFKDKLDINKIAEYTGLSIENIEKLKEEY